MKALTLTQPWATLVAIGAKRIETRSWGTSYCGTIAIHAAKGLNGIFKGAKDWDLFELCQDDPFQAALTSAGYARPGHAPDDQVADDEQLPRGAVVAVATLARCVRMTERGVREMQDLHPEFDFGLYEPGRYAWVLNDVQRLASPVEFRGAQGLFDVPDHLLEAAIA